jgi:spermidine synthase
MRILAITLIVASASMLYEFSLTQVMISLFGGTIFQYTITIGLYAFSLGLGALFYNKKITSNFITVKSFIKLEILLSLCGISFPLLLLLGSNFIYLNIILLIAYLAIFTIGFLSGIELPLLMDLYNKTNSKSFSYKILGFDYFGTLIGSLAYPFLLLFFDIFTIGLIIGIVNLISILLLELNKKIIILLIMLIVILSFSSNLFNYFFIN